MSTSSMDDPVRIDRITTTQGDRFFLRTAAKRSKPHNRSMRTIVTVDVFEGDPSIVGNKPIFFAEGKADTSNLHEAIERVESIALRYIDSRQLTS